MTKGPLDMSILAQEDSDNEFQPRAKNSTRKTEVVAEDDWPRREPFLARPEYAQLGLRTLAKDVKKFKRLAKEGNFTQPQMLRRMIRAYEAHPDKQSLGL